MPEISTSFQTSQNLSSGWQYGNYFNKEMIVFSFSESNRLLTDYELIWSDVIHGAPELYLSAGAVVGRSAEAVEELGTRILIFDTLYIVPYLIAGIPNNNLEYHLGFWVSTVWSAGHMARLRIALLPADWRSDCRSAVLC